MGQIQRAPDRESEREVKMCARFYDAFIAKSKLVQSVSKYPKRFVQVVTKSPVNPIRVGRECTFFELKQHLRRRCVKTEILRFMSSLCLRFFFGHEDGIIGRSLRKKTAGGLAERNVYE